MKIHLPPVMPFGWACTYGEDRIGLWQAFEVAGVRQVMRWIAPGEFLMGSPESEVGRSADERQHRVVLTEGFWMADTACTQALWKSVMGTNPSQFKDDPQNPVEQVSWLDITDEFLPKLNALAPGLDLVLPTEAQWEYACRAGTTTPFSFGEYVTTDQVHFHGNYPYSAGKTGDYVWNTALVKARPVNPWGLYQMHGNVWEWCKDAYFAELISVHVLRGGSWLHSAQACRSASRNQGERDERNDSSGFRLACAAG